MKSDQVLPEAFYDSLSLAHKLDDYLDAFKGEEVHLFAYFALLLFLYKHNSLNDWEYKFLVSDNGYPFSIHLNEAIERHKSNGVFEISGGCFLEISARGVDEFNRFKNMELFKRRETFLSAACTTSIAVPYSQTQKALLLEPELNHARKMRKLASNRWIIEEGDQKHVYKKFAEISKAIGIDVDDLLIPAVAWINYLNASGNSESDEG